MSLTEELYHYQCAFYSARLVLDPTERETRLKTAHLEGQSYLRGLEQLGKSQVRISGTSKGYYFGPAGVARNWIDRIAWLELQPCRIDLVRSSIGNHDAECQDILIVPETRPDHHLSICLLDLELLEPSPAWASV